MKKIVFLFCFFFAFSTLKAQTPLTTAIDFTVTDSYGNSIHLFEILDRGQYVMIDFFFTTCGPCRDMVPGVVVNYSRYGCNQHDVFFMEITPSDNNTICHQWEEEYGIEYYPTMILIAPNKQIIKQDIYPSSAIPTAFASAGIREFECTTGIEESIAINEKVSVYPNPATNQLHVNYTGAITPDAVLEIYDITGNLLLRQNANETNEINISHLANGFYLVKIGGAVKRFVKN